MHTSTEKFDLLLFRRLVYSTIAVIIMMIVPSMEYYPIDSILFTGSIVIIFGSSFLWQCLLSYALRSYSKKLRVMVSYLLLFVALCMFGYAFHLLTTLDWYPQQNEDMFVSIALRNLFFQMTASFLIGLICFVRSLGRRYAVAPRFAPQPNRPARIPCRSLFCIQDMLRITCQTYWEMSEFP